MKKLGSIVLWVGDRFFDIGFEWPAEVCYEAARKLGAKLEWPYKDPGK